MPLKIKTALTA